MTTKVNLFTVGGFSAFAYAIVTFGLYVYMWTRWGIIRSGEAGQILASVNLKRTEWMIIWWGITIIPYAMIPVFLSVLNVLWKGDTALASMAFIAGMIALILGIIGPLRSATTTGTLANIFATGDEAQRAAAQVLYKTGESYGRGLFCLFGAT